MIDRTQPLPVTRHAKVVGIRRGSVYCTSEPTSTPMRRMGITALYRNPNTSRKTPGHTICA